MLSEPALTPTRFKYINEPESVARGEVGKYAFSGYLKVFRHLSTSTIWTMPVIPSPYPSLPFPYPRKCQPDPHQALETQIGGAI